MPIKLPDIQRSRPQAPDSVGTMNVQGPDLSQAQAMNSRTDREILGGAVEMYQKFEDDAAKMESTKAHFEASSLYKSDLEKLKQNEGDPTEAYSKIREDWDQKDQAMMEKYENASDYSKKFIRQRLSQARQEAESQAAVNQTIQVDKFQDTLTASSKALRAENMVAEGRGFKFEKDPKTGKLSQDSLNSFMGVHGQLLEVKKVTEDNLVRKGLIVEDKETGKRKYTDIAKAEILKSSSEALSKLVKVYQDAGAVDKAQWVMDTYKDEIISTDLVKLTNLQDSTQLDIQSLQAVDKIMADRGLEDEEDMYADADEIPDPRVKDKVISKIKQRLEIRRSTEKHMVTKARDDMMSRALNMLDAERKSGGPAILTADIFFDKPEVKNSEAFKRLDAKGRKAIDEVFSPPKTSDEKKLAVAWDGIRTNKYAGMDGPTFFAQLEGISDTDRKPLISEWRKANDPSTPAEERSLTKNMTDELTMQMMDKGFITKQPFGSPLSPKDNKKMIEFRNEMLDAQQTFGKSPSEYNKKIREWLAKKKADDTFKLPTTAVFNPPPAAPSTLRREEIAKAGTGPVTQKKPLTNEEAKNAALEKWKRVKGYTYGTRAGDSPVELKALYQKKD